jgi:carboxypeptidase C (cathepsin A)
MIIELNKKCEKMQNEIKSLKSLELKEKKTVILEDWLKQNRCQDICWEKMMSNIEQYNDEYCVHYLRENSLQKTILYMIDNISSNNIPVVIFSHKKQVIYICHETTQWCESNINKLRELYNAIHKLLISLVNDWAESKGESLYSNDHTSRVYNDLIEKVLCGSSDDGLEKTFKRVDTDMRKKCCTSI